MMTKSIVIVSAFIALQSGDTGFAPTAARLVVTNCIFTTRLVAIARQTTGRQRMELGRALVAELAQHVWLATALTGLLVAYRGQGSILIAATFYGGRWGEREREGVN